ncbi:MAG: hypothetical protein IT220_10205 [Flavobacteriaceae bacterium]|nr:hypothetical protein [Flavobacteriaceae bacterium]
MKEQNRKIENWDLVTKIILGVSILVILFSFFSPLIFTSSTSFKSFDFTETGEIGDTIGGILNPFIALAGIFLTFLAFYMQIKANQIQIYQFHTGLQKEKDLRILTEKKDSFNKLSLLNTDLTVIQSDIKSKSENLKNYYENEKEFPFQTNFLKRTSSRNYARILEIDRLAIFQGFSLFLSHRENWIKDFSRLYNILDFLPEFFQDLYNKYNYHSKDIFEKKMDVRNSLIKLMDELSKIINVYLQENHKDNYLGFPVSRLANDTIAKYYDIIDESFDENRNPIKETDFEKIDTQILKYFNEEALKLRVEGINYDVRLEPIVELIGNIRKQTYLIKQRAQEFASSVENEYNNLVVDGKQKSYLTLINEIQCILEVELNNIELVE